MQDRERNSALWQHRTKTRRAVSVSVMSKSLKCDSIQVLYILTFGQFIHAEVICPDSHVANVL